MTYFDYINRINVTIYKNVFSSHNFFYNISSVVRRKEPELEPEPQFVISAAALVGNLISAPWFSAPAPQHWLTFDTKIFWHQSKRITVDHNSSLSHVYDSNCMEKLSGKRELAVSIHAYKNSL